MMTASDVLVIGGVGLDITVRVPSLTEAAVETVLVPPIVQYVGHTGAGVAFGCQQLGLATRLFDVIGDDEAGEWVRAEVAARGVAADWRTGPRGTRRSVNLVGPDGQRRSFYDGRHDPDLIVPFEQIVPAVATARRVHVTIMQWAAPLLPALVQQGAMLSTDLHDWDGINPYHRPFALAADLVFLSASALDDARLDQITEDIFGAGRARLVVAMAGARGARLRERGRDGWIHLPPVPPPGPVRDTNGAGDAFVAGFLFGRLRGETSVRCAHFGVIAGAWACATEGTHLGLISEDELLAFSAG